MSEKTNELYILTQKAQKMEMINEEIALKIYLEIFESYTPKISKTYESTIRLLEKRQRLDEALKICDLAIELIRADEISGILDRFETTQTRLLRKIEETKPQEEAHVKKAYHFKPKHLIFPAVLILLVFLVLKFTTPFDQLDVNLEGKESLEGGGKVYTTTSSDPTKTYPITDEMKALATRELLKNLDASDAEIIVQEDTLGIAIIVKGGTSETRAKELCYLYLSALAGSASATYDDLSAPKENHLGGLYDHYDLVITIGTGTTEETFIAKGTKGKTAADIYWR